MMAYQETVVRRDQHRIHVRDHPGAGPPIILMHGFPDNLHLYDRLVPYLSPPRRVVLLDFLGWGSSDKPSGYPYTTANQVGDVDAVMQTRLVQAQADEYCDHRRICSQCGCRRGIKDWRTRQLTTLF